MLGFSLAHKRGELGVSVIPYRKDIDGLRAIAVLAVLFYHAEISLFSGGFVGVDVFFVLSGYLISSIILKEFNTGTFSLLNFYERRIRRIFPALFAMITATTCVAAVMMFPPDLKDYGQSMVAASLSLGNVFFWMEAGYFETHSSLKPLLHTWSLGVEEQFYVAFPVFVILLFKCSLQKRLVFLFSLCFALSLIACVVLTPRYPEFSFFLPFTRAWELLLGTLLALNAVPNIKSARANTVLSWAGLLLLIAPIFLFSEKMVFPGAAALIPCLGTAILIYTGGAHQGGVQKTLCLRPMVFVGLISYSLYLWHWSLFAFLKYYEYEALSVAQVLGVIILSFVCALLSWRYIEKPFRGRASSISSKQVFIFGAACVLMASVIGFAFHKTQGFSGRFDERVNMAIGAKTLNNPLHSQCLLEGRAEHVPPKEVCLFGDLNVQNTFVIWGDSHADHYVQGVHQHAAQNGLSGRQITKAGCPPILGVLKIDHQGVKSDDCLRFNKKVYDVLISDPQIEIVILSARWALYSETEDFAGGEYRVFLTDDRSGEMSRDNSRRVMKDALLKTVEGLNTAGKKIVIVGGSPENTFNVPDCLSRKYADIFPEASCDAPDAEGVLERNTYVRQMLLSIKARYGDVDLVFPADLLCNTDVCALEIEGGLVYFDSNHLSNIGAAEVTEYMPFLWGARLQ